MRVVGPEPPFSGLEPSQWPAELCSAHSKGEGMAGCTLGTVKKGAIMCCLINCNIVDVCENLKKIKKNIAWHIMTDY